MNDRPPSSSGIRHGESTPGADAGPARANGAGAGRQAETASSAWSSPLGRWLRGLIDDPSSLLPSLSSVMDAARRELERSSALGVLFVRFETWGHSSRLYGWREIQSVYEVASGVAVSLVGQGIRQLDLPADLGLVGEGFAVLLSAPRDSGDLELEVVDAVADRFADLVRERLSAEVDDGLMDRTTIEVGAGSGSPPCVGRDIGRFRRRRPGSRGARRPEQARRTSCESGRAPAHRHWTTAR